MWKYRKNKVTSRRRSSYIEETWINKDDPNSIIQVSYSPATPMALDYGHANQWYLNVDRYGSTIYGTRVYFDRKQDAIQAAHRLKEQHAEGFSDIDSITVAGKRRKLS